MKNDQIIYDPGKFEGEHVSIPHFYDLSLDSSSSEDVYIGDTVYSFFIIDAEDRKQFPDLTEFGLVIWERSDGFVMSEWYETEDEYKQALAAHQAESADETEEDPFENEDEEEVSDDTL